MNYIAYKLLIIGHNNESFSFEAQPTSINRVDTCEGVSSRIYRAVDLAGVSKTTIVFDSEFLTGIDNEKDYYFISSTTEDFDLSSEKTKLSRNSDNELYLEIDFADNIETFFRLIESRTVLPNCFTIMDN